MKSKIYFVKLILPIVILMACNKAKTKGHENSKHITQTAESTQEEYYTLHKDLNNVNSELYIYKNTIDEKELIFYTKKEIDYGVLASYSGQPEQTRYFIFPKTKQLEDKIVIYLKDALFSKTVKDLNSETLDATEVTKLLKNYVIIGVAGDPSYPNFIIINIRNQKVSEFGTHGSFKISKDERFLIGWKDSKTHKNIELICPEHKDMKDYYVVTEEFKHDLKTGKEELTGTLGCGFVQ